MKILFLAASLLLTATGTAHAQNVFVIQYKGATVGKCTYTFDKSKDGYKVFSSYDLYFPNVPSRSAESIFMEANNIDINQVQQSHEYKLDDTYSYLGGKVRDRVIQTSTDYSPSKDRKTIQLTTTSTGISHRRLTLMPGLFVLPYYDASAVQGLLYQATSHPTPDSRYFIIIYPQSVQSHWTVQPDATGTLAGKPITLHHYSFAFGKHIYNVYADEINTLMETDISGSNLSFIRNGFALDAAVPAAAPMAK